jgi:hypothetical protein
MVGRLICSLSCFVSLMFTRTNISPMCLRQELPLHFHDSVLKLIQMLAYIVLVVTTLRAEPLAQVPLMENQWVQRKISALMKLS